MSLLLPALDHGSLSVLPLSDPGLRGLFDFGASDEHREEQARGETLLSTLFGGGSGLCVVVEEWTILCSRSLCLVLEARFHGSSSATINLDARNTKDGRAQPRQQGPCTQISLHWHTA